MPTRPATVCTEPGCTTRANGMRCDSHRIQHRRAKAAHERQRYGTTTERGLGWDHQKLAAQTIAQQPWCSICGNTKAEVEARGDQLTGGHIIDRQHGGQNIASNYRTECGRCNYGHHTTPTDPPPHAHMANITLIAGPPCAGKTSYAEQHRRTGDVTIDYDALAYAIGQPAHQHPQPRHGYISAARDALIRHAAADPNPPHIWIIQVAPTRRARNYYRRTQQADVVVIETPADVCQQRARDDGRPTRWGHLIDTWWRSYERDERDTTITDRTSRAVTDPGGRGVTRAPDIVA